MTTPAELTAAANAGKPLASRAFAAALLRWYAQPMLPHDPLNNPLIEAAPPYRVAGALRVYARGLAQVIVPWRLSGDYSAPQEPIPTHLVFPASVAGAIALVLPIVACPIIGVAAWLRARRAPLVPHEAPAPAGSFESMSHDAALAYGELVLAPLVGLALAWVAISYIPVLEHPGGAAYGTRRAFLVLPGDSPLLADRHLLGVGPSNT